MQGRIAQLTDMGFSVEASKAALEQTSWNVNNALDRLFAGASNPPDIPTVSDESKLSVLSEEPVTRCPSDTHSQAEAVSADEASPIKLDKRSSETCLEHFPTLRSATTSSPLVPKGEVEVVPECKIIVVAEPQVVPEAEVVPDVEVIPEAAVVPEVEVISEVEVIPEIEVMPDAVTVPESETIPESSPQLKPPDILTQVEVSEAPREPQDANLSVESTTPLHRALETVQGDTAKLGITKGGLVRIWSGTETELGWVYAESVADSAHAGWIAAASLEAVPVGHRLLHAKQSCDASFETQLSVVEGDLFLVDLASTTEQGWAYADKVQACAQKDFVFSGWLAVACLEPSNSA